MAKFVLLFVLAFSSSDWSVTLKDAERQVPRIEVRNANGGGVCSGIVYEPGFVLTAAHCVDAVTEVNVNGRHGKVMMFDHLLDLAILSFRNKSEVALPLAAENPKAGSEVAVLGYPFGSETFHIQQGIVAAPYDRDCKCMKLNADIAPGDSGGAIVNSKGELVGMTTSVFYNGPSHLGGAVPLDKIKDFLDDFRAEQAKKR